jgi:hypothetical protein
MWCIYIIQGCRNEREVENQGRETFPATELFVAGNSSEKTKPRAIAMQRTDKKCGERGLEARERRASPARNDL